MAHPLKHAESSARKFGGRAEDYLIPARSQKLASDTGQVTSTANGLSSRLCGQRPCNEDDLEYRP
jgi:hypothetical protein